MCGCPRTGGRSAFQAVGSTEFFLVLIQQLLSVILKSPRATLAILRICVQVPVCRLPLSHGCRGALVYHLLVGVSVSVWP